MSGQKWYYVLNSQNRAHVTRSIAEAIRTAPEGYILRLAEPTRSIEQNSKLWPMLHDIAEQVLWDGERMTPEEWKDFFTAALKQQRMVKGMDGGIVFVGSSTSQMSKREFYDLIELMSAFSAERGVFFKA